MIPGLDSRLRHWVGVFWPDKGDISFGKVLQCVFSGSVTSLVILLLAKVKPWNLYLLSAFTDRDFQNRITFIVTLLIAALATTFSIGYMTNELLSWVGVKRRWLWRLTSRKRKKE